MPCTDGGPDIDWDSIHARWRTMDELKDRLNQSENRRRMMIDILRKVCYAVEKAGQQKTYFTERTEAWWDDFKDRGPEELKKTLEKKAHWQDGDEERIRNLRWAVKTSESGRDDLAQMLCEFCQRVETKKSQETYFTPELETWWENHQIEDAQRESEEAKVKAEAIKERRRKKAEQEREKVEAEKQREKDMAQYKVLQKKLGLDK